MACNVTTINADACESGIACASQKQLLIIIAQLLCEISEGGGGGGGATVSGGVVDPNGVVTAPQYSIYTNGPAETVWIKKTVGGNTGWTQFI